MTMTAHETPEVSGDLDGFRRRCRSFLQRWLSQRGTVDATMDEARRFQNDVAAAGLAGLTYPREFGGQGLTHEHERVWREELSEAGSFPVAPLAISHGMCLPVMNQFGTPAQKAAHLRRMIAAEEVWCQLFSEPSAGSDVASLQTRANRDGEEWVLNGQKVWSTYAHLCDYAMILARTDPTVPKHEGLTMFMMDMRTPGVDVRPLRQLTGRSEFNEVFLADVRLPIGASVGPVGEGWRVATAMLMYERVAIGSAAASEIVHPLADQLIAEARSRGRASDPVIRQALASLYSREVLVGLGAARTRAAVAMGREPGPAGSIGKLAKSSNFELYRAMAMAIRGASSVAWDGGDGADYAEHVLRTLSSGIAGGTNEIQRNIIGERVLGLPREPSVDRGVPFRDLLTSRPSEG